MKNKQLYIAYGSNINLKQMAYRCPHSKVVGTSEIKDYELEFRGVATIVPSKGTSVPVLIWELDERDLPTLNRYEGYPRLYRQDTMSFDLDGNNIRCNCFTIEVFADESEKIEIDVFSAAVDFELLNNSLEEAEQFAKDYIDCEEKEYQRIIDKIQQ